MSHAAGIDPTVPPSGTGCGDCDAAGGWWFHLRRCAQCGHIGCCDDSPAQHATAHAQSTGPSRSSAASSRARTGSGTTTPSEMYESGPDLAPPVRHPVDQPAPGPAGRVPANWAETLR